MSGPSANCFGSRSILASEREANSALPCSRGNECGGYACGAENAFYDAARAAKGKRANGALARPGSDIFDEGLLGVALKDN